MGSEIDNSDPLNPWFDDKAPQIDCGAIRAFGVLLHTRHDRAIEMAEMLKFAHHLAELQLNLEVTEVHYDSSSCCATIHTRVPLEPFSPVHLAIRDVALRCLGQFEWHGSVLHGEGVHRPLPPDEEDQEVPF